MEERTTTLFKNLNMMYQAELAMIVCLVLAFIPFINIIAVFVLLVAAIINIVALVGLRNVHRDYYSAIGMLVLGVILALFGRGEGTTAFLFETGSSIAKLI